MRCLAVQRVQLINGYHFCPVWLPLPMVDRRLRTCQEACHENITILFSPQREMVDSRNSKRHEIYGCLQELPCQGSDQFLKYHLYF